MAERFAQDQFSFGLFPRRVRPRFLSANNLLPNHPNHTSQHNQRRTAFSLIELLIVLAIAALLMGLLMPSFIRIRESARQVACASNLHQIGIALSLYVDENNDRLPSSYFNGQESRNGGRKSQPGEMIAAYLGTKIGFDSMGWLYQTKLIQSPGVFYCPSHTGTHPFDRYAMDWAEPGSQTIEINYHYRNDINGVVLSRQNYIYFAVRASDAPIVTDGLRTKQDFNHIIGANVLRIDSVVKWVEDDRYTIYSSLPDENDQQKTWRNPWSQLSGR